MLEGSAFRAKQLRHVHHDGSSAGECAFPYPLGDLSPDRAGRTPASFAAWATRSAAFAPSAGAASASSSFAVAAAAERSAASWARRSLSLSNMRLL